MLACVRARRYSTSCAQVTSIHEAGECSVSFNFSQIAAIGKNANKKGPDEKKKSTS